MPTPLVSVILPVHNGARFIAQAIESVLAQNHAALEILVVDDGSTDDSAEIAAQHPVVRVLRQANAGPAAARNRGWAEARGAFIAFIDADDLWPARKLARQLARFDAAPELDVVLGRVAYRDLEGAGTEPIAFEGPGQTLTHVHLGSGLYRREAFARIGAFDARLRYSEDQDWFLRAREAGLKLTILEDVTLVYRRHADNMTRGRRMEQLGVLSAIRQSLARRRAEGESARPLPRWSSMDEKRPPRVSVVIPLFNGAAFVGQAIESLLAQEYPELEILVVDDGSTDESVAIAARHEGVRLIRQDNAGPGAARNAGVAAATGEWIGFLDQDDLWMPGRLHGQVQTMRLHPGADGIMGWQRFELMPGVTRPAWLRESALGLQRGETLGSLLVRRASFERVGRFDESHRTASDVDWLFRAKDLGLVWIRQNALVLRHRIHGANQSNQLGAQHAEYLKLVRQSLLRARRAGA